MKHKIQLLLAIFVFVFVPIIVQGADEKQSEKPPYYLNDEQLDKKLGVDEKVETPKSFLWVVYFHRIPGCDTCQKMSKYVYETIDTKFKDDTKTKNVVLRYKNLDDKKNADLVKKLKLKSPALAVMIVKDGKLHKAKLAGKIFSFAADKEKFINYVAQEINAYKPQLKDEKK